MQSEFGKEVVATLAELKSNLSVWEDAYNEHLENRIGNLDYPEIAPLSKITNDAAEVHVAQYSVLEELISLYEDALSELNTELVDGRTVDYLYADMEDRFEKANRLGEVFSTGSQALDNYGAKMEEEVAKLDQELLAKAVMGSSVHKKLDSYTGQP